MFELVLVHLFGGILGVIGLYIGEWLSNFLDRNGWG